jgi:hypothetical protein
MNEYNNFTSLSPQEEATFVVFERFTQENRQKSLMTGVISGVAVGILGLIIYFGFSPPEKKHAPAAPAGQTQKAPAEAPAPAPK